MLVTFTDKTKINDDPLISDINKIKAEDVNELKQVINFNQVQVETNGDWTLIKYGETSGTFIGFTRKQVSGINITTSAGGEYESSYVNVTNLPSGVTVTSLGAQPTNGSQSAAVHIHRTSITSTAAQVMFWTNASRTNQNCPVFLTIMGTW